MNIAAQRPRLPFREESLKTSKNPCLIKFGKCEPDLGVGGYFCIRHPRADVISKECNTDVRRAGTSSWGLSVCRVFIRNKRMEKEKEEGERKGNCHRLNLSQSAAAPLQKYLSRPHSLQQVQSLGYFAATAERAKQAPG